MPTIDTSKRVQARAVDSDRRAQLQQGCVVDNCKSNDKTPAPTPQLLRAICFDQAKPDAQIVPQPPPNPYWPTRPRDPTLIELGNIEIDSHLEFISLSDNPAANFDDKSDVRQLELTGYDVANRRGTVALTPEEMANEGFKPGEQIVLRQVDKNGNASDGIFVHLDPSGWANQQIRQTDDNGQQVQLRGAQIQFTDGEVGLPGAEGQMKKVLGTAVRDTDAPKLVEQNVSLKTFSYSKEEVAVATELMNASRNWIYQQLRTTNFNLDQAKALLAKPDVPPNTKTALEALTANDGRMFQKLDNANDPSTKQDGIVGDPDLQRVIQLGVEGRDVYLSIDRALEPQTTFNLQNSRTGDNKQLTLGADQRTALVRLGDTKDGDPLVLTFHDQAGNQGKPYAMEFSSTCKDGKAGFNPLSVRYGGSSVGTKDG